MALLVCRKCSTKFSVGAPFCPQCTAEDAYIEGTEEDEMPRNTVAGASLGVQHPDYVEGGPVPPIVPVGDALDAPISDQLDAAEAVAGGSEPTDDGVLVGEAGPELVDSPDGTTVEPVAATADPEPVKPAPKKTTRK